MAKPLKQSPLLFAGLCFSVPLIARTIPIAAAIDAKVGKVMAQTGAKGMAVAVIDHGKIAYLQAYGIRNPKRDPLTTDTVLYGASLTKPVFTGGCMRPPYRRNSRYTECAIHWLATNSTLAR